MTHLSSLCVWTGSVLNPGVSNLSDAITVIDIDTIKMYQIPDPVPGNWTISIELKSNNKYSLEVTARVGIGFSYLWVDLIGGIHPGYRTLDGKPISGVLVYLVLKINLLMYCENNKPGTSQSSHQCHCL